MLIQIGESFSVSHARVLASSLTSSRALLLSFASGTIWPLLIRSRARLPPVREQGPKAEMLHICAHIHTHRGALGEAIEMQYGPAVGSQRVGECIEEKGLMCTSGAPGQRYLNSLF